jgi:predicted CXXCH cytochrome family protein
MKRNFLITIGLCLALALVCVWALPRRGAAQEKAATYVGTDTCLKCHAKVAKNWALTVHRRTLFNTDCTKKGCEACHGPGSAHVENGGDPDKIVRLDKLSPAQSASVCLKCHTQEHVTLWRTSTHARAKLTCINCHDVHAANPESITKDIADAKLQIEGLTRSIKDAQLESDIAAVGSKAKEDANTKVAELKAKRDQLLDELKGNQTVFSRTTEPYLCYNCHKNKQAQSNLPSHHPIREGKMVCSDCHNPHGGPQGMLKEESVNETCFRCHAEKVGPFTFDHPPVTENCTICHNPHGSVNNNLLTQNQTFICLRCHFAPHSGSTTANGPSFATRYAGNCTGCHTEIHGSNNRKTFIY